MELDGKLFPIEYGGQNIYGYDIGILMLESSFPRIPGDIGNALTWKFPVLYKIVKGGTPRKVVGELTMNDIKPFVDAAKELEAAGVRAITTSCGFLSLFQKELSKELNIPVFTSALLLVPMIKNIIGNNKNIVILTANKSKLSESHLHSVGINDLNNIIICGLEDGQEFSSFSFENRNSVDINLCLNELLEHVDRVMIPKNNVGAIVLECTNMPPYSKYIQERAKVPVFDIVSLTNMIHYSYNLNDYLRGM